MIKTLKMKYILFVLFFVSVYFILRKRASVPAPVETFNKELACFKKMSNNWQKTEEYKSIRDDFHNKVNFWTNTLRLKYSYLFNKGNYDLNKHIIFNNNKTRGVLLLYKYDPKNTEDFRLYGKVMCIPSEKINKKWYFFYIMSVPLMIYRKSPNEEAPPLSHIIDQTLLYSIKSGLILKDSCEINEAYFNEAFFPDNRWELLEKFEKGEYPNQ